MSWNVAVAGVAQTKVARRLPASPRETAARVARDAIADAGLEKRDIDALVATPLGLGGPPSFMWACELADYLQIATRSLSLVECGGATAALALKAAALEIAAGRARAALVVAVDFRSIRLGDDLAHFVRNAVTSQTNLYGPYASLYGLGAPIPYYAMSCQRYLHEHGLRDEDMAHVPVTLRRHAAANEYAEYRDPITVGDVMSSPMQSPPLTLLMCSPFASGGAACVVARADVAPRAPRLRAIGEDHHPSHFVPSRGGIGRFPSAEVAAARAFEEARCAPADVGVAEIYGVFAGTEAMLLEDMGFFPRGTALRAFAEGRAEHVDPSGGRLSLGHPAGATPLLMLCEVVRKLRAGRAGLGLVHAEHGMANGSIVTILEAAA